MNNLNYINHITRDKWKTIAEQYNIDTILVFGSIVTEDFQQDSDIDFAVIGQSSLSLEQKLSLELDLEQLLDREIDVIDLSMIAF